MSFNLRQNDLQFLDTITVLKNKMHNSLNYFALNYPTVRSNQNVKQYDLCSVIVDHCGLTSAVLISAVPLDPDAQMK